MRNVLDTRECASAAALFAALVGATLLGGCAVEGASSQPSISTADQASCTTLPDQPEDTEYAFFRDRTFTFKIPGFFTAQAETFFIWNLGTSIQHDAPYPSSSHGKLFGVFAPGPAGAEHQVEGQPNFDHYHVLSVGEGTQTLDGFLVFPGPNFNPATFVSPRSEREINAAVAAGTLAPPLLTTDAGLGPLVIKVPVKEFELH